MSWLKRGWGKDRKLRRQPIPDLPTGVAGTSTTRHERVPEDALSELVERFPLRSGTYDTLLPPMTDELVGAQRAGAFLAADIVRGYADRLYTAIWAAIGGGGDEPPAPRHGLLVRAGRVTSADDPTRPAVPLREQGFFGTRATLGRVDERGIDPNLHLTAAARALASARSVKETGGQAGLSELLDRAWFLLAFWLSNGLGDGGIGRMLNEERRLVVHLVGCCSRLQVLGEVDGPPPFVIDAVENDLVVRHFDEEWVTSARVLMADGEVVSEGRLVARDSGRPLRVGALLGAQLHCDASPTGDPAEEFALGMLKAEADDLVGARAAFERARSHPSWSERAEASLRDLLPEEASVELLLVVIDWGSKTRDTELPGVGSPAGARVVEIGERLYLAGGMSLMRQAYEAFSRRTDRREEVSWLAITWDGIGDWQS
jgi:hypothetical protein